MKVFCLELKVGKLAGVTNQSMGTPGAPTGALDGRREEEECYQADVAVRSEKKNRRFGGGWGGVKAQTEPCVNIAALVAR